MNFREVPSYRQRLTLAGWAGVALLIICPMTLAHLYRQLLDARYSFQEPSVMLIFLVAVGAALAPVLILVGREHYPVKTAVRD